MDPNYRTPFYFLQGHLGQYVIVVPSAQLVVVRLGQVRHRTYERHPKIPDEIYRYVDEGLRMAQR
jgi:CubicO group peptidase (beta-lactamase class C family)